MATKTKSAAARLAELEEAVREAERRGQQIDADRGKASRALNRAEGERLELERRRAAGEDVDDAELADAVKAIAEARELAEERVWSARREGAAEAVQAAEMARDEFGRRHFAEIAAEEVPLDEPARVALEEAWGALQGAASAYAVRVRRWHHLARYGDISAEQIPTGTPLGDLSEAYRRFETRLEPPTPRSLR